VADYLRIASPIELWDGTATREERAASLANEPDWSLYQIGSISARTAVAAYWGNRTGHAPLHDPGYVLLPEDALTSFGRVIPARASFTWPPEVSSAHHDLVEHTTNARALVDALDAAACRIQTIPRAELLAEIATLARRGDADAAFRKNARKRLERVRDTEPQIWRACRDAAAAAGCDADEVIEELRRRR
jgi:hypothetical protein